MIIKQILAILLLLSVVFVTLATSALRNLSHNGSYYIRSECVSPPVENHITVAAGEITSPGGVTLANFGLPGSVLSRDEFSGTVNGKLRSCAYEYVNDDEEEHVISCYEDNVYICSAYLKGQ